MADTVEVTVDVTYFGSPCVKVNGGGVTRTNSNKPRATTCYIKNHPVRYVTPDKFNNNVAFKIGSCNITLTEIGAALTLAA